MLVRATTASTPTNLWILYENADPSNSILYVLIGIFLATLG
jgi:hypothetical protein